MTKDFLIYNANFTQINDPSADALWISEGKVKAVGSTSELRDALPKDAHRLDLEGQTVLPGLNDFHLHLQYLADRLDAINCETDSLDELLRRVQRRADLTPAGEWIVGYGWNQNDWQPAEYGTAAQLDAISQKHPILLHAKSLHAAWANSLAMKIAGIDAARADPEKGIIIRDQAGEPTGILLESAVLLVEQRVPKPSPEAIARKILLAQTHLHSIGITGVHDFDRFDAAEALLLLVEQDLLRLRVSQNLPSEQYQRVLEENWRTKLTRPPYLRPGWLKLFADGALGPQSAALLSPYENSQDAGLLLLSAQDLAEIGIAGAKDSWPLAVHAIGDRAVREVLDGFALLRDYERQKRLPRLPHRIEHIQLIHPQDLRRMRALEINASVQPTHATSDMFTADHHWGDRCQFAYAYQSMIEQGLNVRFGSDAPVEHANPFEGLFAATTRQRPDGKPGSEGWYPRQRISLSDALKAFSLPFSSGSNGNHTNPLSPGSFADLIVLDKDPFKVSAQELFKLKPVLTMVSGEIVFSR